MGQKLREFGFVSLLFFTVKWEAKSFAWMLRVRRLEEKGRMEGESRQ